MSEVDPMAIQHAAMNAAFTRASEQARDIAERLGSRPALAEAEGWDKVFADKPAPAAERRRAYLMIRDDPQALMQELQAAAEGLPPDRPIPRAFIDALLEGERLIKDDLAEVQKQADREQEMIGFADDVVEL